MNLKLLGILSKLKNVWIRYPFVVLMSVLMAFCAIYLVDSNYPKSIVEFNITKLLIVSALGISLTYALNLLAQRIGKSLVFSGLGVVFLVGFYFVLPKHEADFTEVYSYLLITVFILSHLLVAFIAFLKPENTENNFWQFNKNLFVNFILTLIFTFVLVGGVELAILAIDQLFEMDFDGLIYPKVFLFFLIFGSTLIFLLFNEMGLSSLEKEGEYPVVLKFFTQFILIPLLLIYVVILYLYAAKIVVQWELPRGWVSYMILAYSIVGILALLLVHPLKEKTAKSWVKVFSRVFYYTLIPLLILLFTAIFTRILNYAYTEPRYFVLLLAIWLSCLVLYFTFFKKANIKFIPISLFVFGLFGLIFPYLNAFSVAKRSQKNDLERLLNENNLLVNGKIDFNQSASDTLIHSIESKFEFLDERFQRTYLLTFLNEKAQKKVPENHYWNMSDFFSEVISTTGQRSYMRKNLVATTKFQDISTYAYSIDEDVLRQEAVDINGDIFTFNTGRGQACQLILNGKDSVDFAPQFKALFEQHKGLSEESKVEHLFMVENLGKYEVKLGFESINMSQFKNDPPNYWLSNAQFFIKEKS